MEINFKEFKLDEDKPIYQITGTVNKWCISDRYNRDSVFWRFNRWRAERSIIRGFVQVYKRDINEAYKNYRTK